ncbi:MAG: PDZ domain-containing protein [Acidobacteria bacterium]|nr:PDZ domain-containing protein [Acidobacteriota bacterium]
MWIADLDTGKTANIDRSTYSWEGEWWPRWSPDSRWLAYSKHLKNRIRTAFIYDTDAKRSRQVSDGVTHVEQPCFDANGKYLYFLSSPNAGTSHFGWGVLSGILARPLVTRNMHAMILQADGQSPIMPNGSPNPEANFGEPAKSVRIDFEGLDRRVIDLPLPSHDFTVLAPGLPGRLLVQINEWPDSPTPLRGGQSVLYGYALSSPSKMEKMIERVSGFEVSSDGAKLLYGQGPYWYLTASDVVPKPNDGRVDISKLTLHIDPSEEWKQIYRESWRIMRDWFYDKNHHGLNLNELEKRYSEYLPGITRRSDLNELLNRMLGHVSVSHLGVAGGDVPPPGEPSVRIGLLGADYEIAGGRYRFRKIYRSSIFSDAAGSARSPLDWPGVDVREGDFLIAVDGQNITADNDIYSYFVGKRANVVKLTVAMNADGMGSRTVTVHPIHNESELRGADQIESYRRRVEAASGGKLGYIYIGDFGSSIMHFIRLMAGYSDREGIIVDQRYNGGGITSDFLIEWLQRKALYYYAFREGDDLAVPVNPAPATKVLITNEQNFSAAETFAFMFKLGKVGPIVGNRTGGGGIGPYVYTPRLIDGGRIQLPNRAAYNPDGTSWGIENIGVIPDFEVDVKPDDVIRGRDPQIEKAIQVALEYLKKNRPPAPRKPQYPVHN